MHVTPLGSSWLNVPFAFPNGDIADSMTTGHVPTSSFRASQLVTMYWDGVDEKSIPVLSDDLTARASVLLYLTRKGVSRMEAAAFITAMISLEDKSWLFPRWSYTKTVIQDATGTGAQGSGGSKSFSLSGLLIPAAVILILYGVATTATSTLLSRRK